MVVLDRLNIMLALRLDRSVYGKGDDSSSTLRPTTSAYSQDIEAGPPVKGGYDYQGATGLHVSYARRNSICETFISCIDDNSLYGLRIVCDC